MITFKEFLNERVSQTQISGFTLEELNKKTNLSFELRDNVYVTYIDDSSKFVDLFYTGKENTYC